MTILYTIQTGEETMKFTANRITALFLCAVLLSACILPAAAAPIRYDEAYSTVAKVGESNGCYSTQGFAAGGDYLYSAQIRDEENNEKAVIYRIHKTTGEKLLMKDGETDLTYFTTMGHANDMDFAKIGGVEYLYVLGTYKILVYRIDNDTLHLHATYNLKYNGNDFGPGGMTIKEVSSTHITFLFKWSTTISTASAALSATSTDLNVSIVCYVDESSINVNGTNRSLTHFLHQGIFYKDNILFSVLSGCSTEEEINHSAIIGYDIRTGTPSPSQPVSARDDLVFYIVSEEYPALFEIEDCSITDDGKLYFNTNGRLTPNNTTHDGVFMLEDFTFTNTPVNPNPGTPDNPDNPGTPSNPDSPDIDSQIYLYLAMLYSREYDITATAGVGGSISDAGVTKVKYSRSHTYTITPEAGYEIESVLVNGKDVGPVSSYTFDRVNKEQTISVTFKKLAWVNPFTDVSKADWFYSDVKYVAEKGIMNGVENGRFDPAAEADRAMLVTTLWRMEGSPIVNYLMQFEDVPGEQWYTEAVRWSAAMQIVEGYDGHFCPEDSITREEIVTILCRFAQHNGVDKAPTAAEITHDCSDWAQEYILWAQANGILDGIGTDISDMTATASRAEIAAFLSRFMKNVMGK